MSFKEKIKKNYDKGPKSVISLGLLSTVSLFVICGVLVGAIEPETATSTIARLFNLLIIGS